MVNASAIARGSTDAIAQGFVDMLRAKEEGMDNVTSRATAVIGPTSFRQWAEEELKPAIARIGDAKPKSGLRRGAGRTRP